MDFNNKFTDDSWAENGTTAEPSENLRQSGFQGGYKPPANVFNWFWRTVMKAVTELQTKLSGVDSAVAGKADATALTAHTGNKSNPHSVTKAQVGLSNVDNTSDLNKPISTAVEAALDNKANEWIATTSGDGSKYTVTLDPAPTELYVGMTITMIPNVTSKVNAVSLNVNGLGEKGLRLRSSTSTLGSEALPSAGYLLAGDPVTLLYDGSYWIIEGTGVYSHATTSSKYGLGTSSNYGHVKLSNSTTNNSGAGMGVAATPAAVKTVADDLDTHTGNTTVHVTSTEKSTWNGKANVSHTHGNVTSDGKIGTAANKAVYTGTNGVLQAGTLPVSAGGTGATSTSSAPFLAKTGGTLTGALKVGDTTTWTTGYARNIVAGPAAPTTSTCPLGQIYLQYE